MNTDIIQAIAPLAQHVSRITVHTTNGMYCDSGCGMLPRRGGDPCGDIYEKP